MTGHATTATLVIRASLDIRHSSLDILTVAPARILHASRPIQPINHPMAWLYLFGALICAWAALRVIGAERQRRVREIQYKLANPPSSETPQTATAPAVPPIPTVRSKP